MKKYSEQILRYPALTDEGKACEILERITYGREVLEDGSLGEPELVNRRFDLKTGETLVRVDEDHFEDQETGARLRLQR